jgi:choline-sulfatase
MIMADQMSFDMIHALGNEAVITPNMDELVRTGSSFTNCYCNSPLCTPSRASLMTGVLPRRHGVFDNGSELQASFPTFTHVLRCTGYRTVLSGKMHFIGPDQLHGFDERLTTDIYPSGFVWTPDWSRGAYHNAGTGVRRLQKTGECDWNMQLEYDEEVLNRTLERLRLFYSSPEDKPFFLCASFTHPHDPFEITGEYLSQYDGVDVPPPAVGAIPLREMHPYDQWIQIHHERDVCQLDTETIAQNRRSYYAMTTYFDTLVGKIIGETRRLGLDRDTVFIVTSDHGEMLGERGMWFKRTYFDRAQKVPLIFSGKGIPYGKRYQHIVSLLDVTHTVLDMSGAARDDSGLLGEDGESFLKILSDHNAQWKNEALFEYYGEGPIHGMIGIRRGRYKYVYIHTQLPLLFDLEEDPLELVNLAADPNYADIARDLHSAITSGWNGDDMERRIHNSQKERAMLNRSIRSAGAKNRPWDHQPFFDESRHYRRD